LLTAEPLELALLGAVALDRVDRDPVAVGLVEDLLQLARWTSSRRSGRMMAMMSFMGRRLG
jgi:hypothetical protein